MKPAVFGLIRDCPFVEKRPFSFFLDMNDIPYYWVDEKNIGFESAADLVAATRIWKCLTGSDRLGRFLNVN